MTASELSADGTFVLRTLTSPERTLPAVAQRRRVAVALLVATVASLATAAVVLPRLDFAAGGMPQQQRGPDAGPEPTPYEREQEAATARKVGQIAGVAGAALSPALLAFLAAAGLAVGFRVAGTRPAFKSTLAVTAHGMLPVWLGGLLAIPAAVAQAPVPVTELPRLVPDSLAALVPGAPPPLAAALGAFDLFTVWALGLVIVGMARASGASKTRSAVTTLVLFLSYVALFKVAPAAQMGGPH